MISLKNDALLSDYLKLTSKGLIMTWIQVQKCFLFAGKKSFCPPKSEKEN